MTRRAPLLYLAALIALGNLRPAAADALPQPTEPLKDYQGRGVIQIDLAPGPGSPGDSTKVVDAGVSLGGDVFQAYVWPDRTLVRLQILGARQVFLTMADAGVERQYNPGSPYFIERTYKNLDKGTAGPLMGVQLSMATYARMLREIRNATLLPDENFDKQKAANEARIAELRKLREGLNPREHPENLNRFNSVSGEMARLRDDINQMEFRKRHPCCMARVENRELLSTLFSRGLMGSRVRDRMEKGKTTFWVTRAEGLPVRLESTDNEGRVALYFCFLDVRINTGLNPGDVALDVPPGTRRISVSADVRSRDWEGRMEQKLAEEIAAFEQERIDRNKPRPVQVESKPRKRKK